MELVDILLFESRFYRFDAYPCSKIKITRSRVYYLKHARGYKIEGLTVNPLDVYYGHNPFLANSDIDFLTWWLKAELVSLLGVKTIRYIELDSIINFIEEEI